MEKYNSKQIEEISKMLQAYACYSTLRDMQGLGEVNEGVVQEAKELYESVTPLSIRQVIKISLGFEGFKRKLENIVASQR